MPDSFVAWLIGMGIAFVGCWIMAWWASKKAEAGQERGTKPPATTPRPNVSPPPQGPPPMKSGIGAPRDRIKCPCGWEAEGGQDALIGLAHEQHIRGGACEWGRRQKEREAAKAERRTE